MTLLSRERIWPYVSIAYWGHLRDGVWTYIFPSRMLGLDREGTGLLGSSKSHSLCQQGLQQAVLPSENTAFDAVFSMCICASIAARLTGTTLTSSVARCSAPGQLTVPFH